MTIYGLLRRESKADDEEAINIAEKMRVCMNLSNLLLSFCKGKIVDPGDLRSWRNTTTKVTFFKHASSHQLLPILATRNEKMIKLQIVRQDSSVLDNYISASGLRRY